MKAPVAERARGFRLYLPRDLTIDTASRWQATIAAITHPPRWSLFPLQPVILEVVATHQGITHEVLVATSMRGALLASVQATLPGARLERVMNLRTNG